MKFETSPERAALVEKLCEHLSAVPVGAVATYEAIFEATGLIVSDQRDLLYQAMKRLNETSGMVFANLHRRGYQRVETEKVHTVGCAARASIRGKAKRTVKRLTNAIVKSNATDIKTNAKASAEIAVLGLIGRAAEDRTLAKVMADGPVPVESVSLSKFVNLVRGV